MYISWEQKISSYGIFLPFKIYSLFERQSERGKRSSICWFISQMAVVAKAFQDRQKPRTQNSLLSTTSTAGLSDAGCSLLSFLVHQQEARPPTALWYGLLLSKSGSLPSCTTTLPSGFSNSHPAAGICPRTTVHAGANILAPITNMGDLKGVLGSDFVPIQPLLC